ncbi:hypothetical protein JWH08_00225, partial [Xanthomonas campestris pv. campestris]|uniref:hypothetical protein n=1 Tax=Xanthomonas campestris TaxID=339 RepID=UPI001E4D2197
DKPDDLLGAESALLHVRPLGFTDFIASAGTAQWGQVIGRARIRMTTSIQASASLIASTDAG